MNTPKLANHQDTKSTKPKDLGVLGDLGGSTQPPLPPGWRWVRLGEVCQINPPRPTLDRRDDAPTTFVPMSAVSAETGRIEKPEVRPFAQVRKGYTYFEEGDVLFAKITPCMQNGKHAVARDLIGGFGFGTTEFHVLRPAGEVLPEWVHAFLRQPAVLEAAAENFAGTVGQQRLPEEYLAALPIPLPPLAEQERLVGVLRERLGAVARARRAAEEQLAAARALPAAYLRAVFSSPEAQQWPRRPFGQLVENYDGRRIPVKQEDRRKRKGPYPYYGASGVIDFIDDFLFDGEYLLIGEDGANLILRSSPIAFKATGKFWVNNHAHVVRPKDGVLLDYLLHFFAVTDLSTYVTGAAQPKLTQADLNSIPVPVPPLERQHRLERELSVRLAAVERLRRSLEEQLAAIEALPAALLRQAFRGEL